MIHRLVPIVVTATLLAGAVPARSEVWREQSERTFEARGLDLVRVENPRGFVLVRRGEPGRIRLTALKTIRANDAAQKRRLSRNTTVVSDDTGDRLRILVQYPQRESVQLNFWDLFHGYEMPRVEVRLTLEVPDGLEVQLHSTSGDLETEQVSGPQSVTTTSGDVRVQGAGSRVRIETTSGDVSMSHLENAVIETVSGDIEAEAVSGALRVSTTSGDVAVKGVEDSLRVVSVSGDIRIDSAARVRARSTSGGITVQDASRSVRLESSSGDIRVGLAPPLARADITTVSGDIIATLTAPMGIELEMRTTNGTLDVDVPMEVRSVTRRLVSGVIGNGRAPVTLRSSSGDIHLSSGGNP